MGNRLVIKQDIADDRTAGGIIIPDTAKESLLSGIVISSGPGERNGEDGERIPMDVNVGDKVMFGQYAGTPIKINGESFTIMRENDIYGVVEEIND